MRISALFPLGSLAICVLAALQAVPARGQGYPDWMIEAFRNRPADATLRVRPKPAGDVEFTLTASGMRRPVDFPAIVQKVLGCDWKAAQADEDEVAGTCRHLLGSTQGGVDGRLQLAPVVLALRGSGAAFVFVNVVVDLRRRSSVETAGAWRRTDGWHQAVFYFRSDSFAALPPPIEIRQGSLPRPTWLAMPLLAVLAIPGAIAFALRRRDKGSASSRALVWLAWLQLGTWLAWLAVLPPGRIVELLELLPVQSFALNLLAGTLAYALPPLVSGAICLLVFRGGLDPELQSLHPLTFLRRYFLPEAALAMFFGFPLMGLALSFQGGSDGLMALLFGFTALIALLWLAVHRKGGKVEVVKGGEFLDRVREISRRAGVPVNKVSILWNRSRGETNAMVWPLTRHIYLTDSLLRNLTKREVDAVMAHEVGHLLGLPFGFPPKLYGAFLFVYPMGHVLLSQSPVWEESFLPFVAAGVLLLAAWKLRTNEFKADARSAQITQDPWAMIAGLGRLAGTRAMALDWGPVAGSILSHPSCRNRALALARLWRLPEAQALAVLENPGLVDNPSSPISGYYELPREAPSQSLAFSKKAKTAHLAKSAFALPGLLLLLVFALSTAASLLPRMGAPLSPAAAFLAGLPLVLWLALRTDAARHRSFYRRTALAACRRLPEECQGEIVGLTPGDVWQAVEGFLAWDFGRLGTSGDSMTYTGEQTRFSLPRSAIVSVEGIGRLFGWRRAYGVRIRWQGGSFIVLDATKAGSGRRAVALQNRWRAWWKGEGAAAAAPLPAAVFSPPEFPAAADPPPAGKAVRFIVTMSFLLLVAGWGIGAMLPSTLPNALAVPAAPLLYVAAHLPALLSLRQRRAPAPAGEAAGCAPAG